MVHLLVTAIGAAHNLPNARMPFSNSAKQKVLHVALHCHESYHNIILIL